MIFLFVLKDFVYIRAKNIVRVFFLMCFNSPVKVGRGFVKRHFALKLSILDRD